MAEIITEPDTAHVVHHVDEESNSGAWVAFAAIALVIILAMLFFYYALPMLNRATTTPQVNVPDKVDVNINRTQ